MRKAAKLQSEDIAWGLVLRKQREAVGICVDQGPEALRKGEEVHLSCIL